MNKYLYRITLLSCCMLYTAGVMLLQAQEGLTVQQVKEGLVQEMYQTDQIDRINEGNQETVLSMLNPLSRQVFAQNYWTFSISSDADIYVCRDMDQQEVPFWLVDQQFERTSLRVQNAAVTYELWKKTFQKGKVGLGINGFDRHRFAYFVLVDPLDPGDAFAIDSLWPVVQDIQPIQVGSVIYADWDELTVETMPPSLQGAWLLPTWRGRSREAHLLQAFRSTRSPSTAEPDQILLSWEGDPKTTMSIGWRTSMSVQYSAVKYRLKGSPQEHLQVASATVLTDWMIRNDRQVKRFHVQLQQLQPGSTYEYQVIREDRASAWKEFTTDSGDDTVEFAWFGDIHNDSQWGAQLPRWRQLFPNVSFYLQAGDLVNTGLYRDDWDALFQASASLTNRSPFMAVPGNHDSQEGLFPSLYLQYLRYPQKGPFKAAQGLSYAFDYGHVRFIMLDAVTFTAESQRQWLEEVLKGCTQRFKIVAFHFPTHSALSSYVPIENHWDDLLQSYGVDMVLNGHFHYYHRTPQDSPSGPANPVRVMSVATEHKPKNKRALSDAQHVVYAGYLMQHIKVQQDTLTATAVDSTGAVIDFFKIIKTL